MMLIMGFVVAVTIAIILFGYSMINDTVQPRTDAQFSVEAINETHIRVFYDQGRPFTSGDTKQLAAVVTEPDGNQTTVPLYEESRVTATGDGTLEPGTTVIKAENAAENGVRPGSTIQFVWIPEKTNEQRIVDQLTILPEQYIFLERSGAGGLQTGGSIYVNGTEQ